MSSTPDFDALNPRLMGRVNWIGVQTLVKKEVGRFLNVYMQTIIAPVITLMMFFTVFTLSIKQHAGAGSDLNEINGAVFLAPGLLMMAMVQNAFANTSSSLIIAKVQKNIVDVLMPPLSALEILVGMLTGALLRCVMIAVLGFVMMRIITPLPVENIFHVFVFGFLGVLMLASLGIVAGLWAEKFDHMATVTNFIITPLTFLSGTFYSLSALPEGWQGIAQLNPFFYMIDGFRAGFTGVAETHMGAGVLMLIIINILLLTLAWWMLKSGYKTKS